LPRGDNQADGATQTTITEHSHSNTDTDKSTNITQIYTYKKSKPNGLLLEVYL